MVSTLQSTYILLANAHNLFSHIIFGIVLQYVQLLFFHAHELREIVFDFFLLISQFVQHLLF